MKIAELFDELKQYAVDTVSESTCDIVHVGFTNKEITGVAVSMFATPDVARKAVASGANMLIVHEPTFYGHGDDIIPYAIGYEKKKFLESLGITVVRFHDHCHAAHPDMIFEGEMKYAKLLGKHTERSGFGRNHFELENEMTALELAKTLENNLGLRRVRICGCTDQPGKKIACCFGTPGHIVQELENNDFVLTGELSEPDQAEAARDYAQLGYNKAIIVMTHIGSERAGMMILADKLCDKHPEFPVQYIECGEAYQYTDD